MALYIPAGCMQMRNGGKVPTLTYTGKSIRLFDESHFRSWV